MSDIADKKRLVIVLSFLKKHLFILERDQQVAENPSSVLVNKDYISV